MQDFVDGRNIQGRHRDYSGGGGGVPTTVFFSDEQWGVWRGTTGFLQLPTTLKDAERGLLSGSTGVSCGLEQPET